MKNESLYGSLTPHTVGIVMKDVTHRAMSAIAEERTHFEAKAKIGYGGELNDLVTSADGIAQGIYTKIIGENFPQYGIIAEEDNLSIECTMENGEDLFFTIDPLDGTKAFARGQSQGVGSMIALVHNGKVIAACIGDIMTGEMFYYRPESHRAHRLGRNNMPEKLPPPDPDSKLTSRYVIIRDRESAYHPLVQKIVAPPRNGGLMDNIEITGGSIGIFMSRLWKNEFGMAVLKAGHQTPWDWAPVVGISEKLDYQFFMTYNDDCRIVQFDPTIPRQPIFFEQDIIVVHKNYAAELLQFVDSLKREEK